MGRQAADLLRELAERLATESGWIVAAGTLSGVGGSAGTFSATHDALADLKKTILERTSMKGSAGSRSPSFGFGWSARVGDRGRRRAHSRRGHVRHAGAHLEPWCRGAEEFQQAVRIAGVVGNERDLLPGRGTAQRSVLRDGSAGIDREGPTPRRLMVGPRDRGHRDSPLGRRAIWSRPPRVEAELRLIQGAWSSICGPIRGSLATLIGSWTRSASLEADVESNREVARPSTPGRSTQVGGHERRAKWREPAAARSAKPSPALRRRWPRGTDRSLPCAPGNRSAVHPDPCSSAGFGRRGNGRSRAGSRSPTDRARSSKLLRGSRRGSRDDGVQGKATLDPLARQHQTSS